MRTFVLQTPFKPIALSTLLAALLTVTLWGLMQQPSSSRFVALAANEGVRFFNQQNVPLANRDIRLLCFQGTQDTNPSDVRFVTTHDGTMPVPLPAGCTHVAAMQLWHIQPSGKPGHGPAYWVYTTSWHPGSSEFTAISSNETTRVTISDTHTLVLFNVVVGLAWEPPDDSEYVSNLLKGLGENSVLHDGESASSYLYDLTNGVMAFGPVTVYTNGESWEGTDIRVLPANDLKPSAQVGGIVNNSFNYTSTVFVTSTTVYSPGAITLGRNWVACAPPSGDSPHLSGYLIACNQTDDVTNTVKLYGASDSITFGPSTLKYGNWDDAPGYRTIVHEWAHYALFLYDEYQTVQGQPADCTSGENKLLTTDRDNASAMDWHYTASELWHAMPPPADCAETKQYVVHGLTDCATLAAWFVIQQIPDAHTLPPLGCDAGTSDAEPSSLGLAKFLFRREPPELEPTPTPISPVPEHSRYLPLVARSQAERNADQAAVRTTRAKPASSAGTIIDALVTVSADLSRPRIQSPPSALQSYQLRPNAAELIDRIWYQGKVVTDTIKDAKWEGHVTILGAEDEFDQVKVFGESYTTDQPRSIGGRWFGEAVVSQGASVILEPLAWPASMDLEYQVNPHGQVVTVTAHVTLPVVQGGTPIAPLRVEAGIQLCSPDSTIRCYWDQKLALISTTATEEHWQATISPTTDEPTLPNYGIVRLYVPYSTADRTLEDRDLITWYKTSGVGPGSFNANAPTPPAEDDVVTLYSETVRRHCNQLIFSAATNYDMLVSPLGRDGTGNPIMGLLGQPVDIAVRLPLEVDGDVCPERFGLGSRKIAQEDIYLTLSYNHLYEVIVQDTIRDDLPADVEENLHILYFDPGTGWQEVAPLSQTQNLEMNWISLPFEQDGIYAIGWVEP